MIDWDNFDSVFRSKTEYAPDPTQVDTIVRNRKELGGILFFDRIWSSIGLKQPQKGYPPRSNSDLRSLWQKVVKAEVTDQKKQALLFYILRDCRQPNNMDTAFAQKVYLPVKYQILVTGLWELDHLQYTRALEYLTNPFLTPEFADDILLTLLTAPNCEKSLATAYYMTTQPPLAKQETLEAYFELMIETSIEGAYHFCCKRDKSTHKALFGECLRLLHEEEASAVRAKRVTALLNISFTEEEEDWFEEYLTRGPGSKIVGAKDSVIMYRLVHGRPIAGPATVDRHRGQKSNDVDWDDIRTMVEETVPQGLSYTN